MPHLPFRRRDEFAKHRELQPEWPWLTVIGDVCRDNLLFEAEVTACEPAKRQSALN